MLLPNGVEYRHCKVASAPMVLMIVEWKLFAGFFLARKTDSDNVLQFHDIIPWEMIAQSELPSNDPGYWPLYSRKDLRK